MTDYVVYIKDKEQFRGPLGAIGIMLQHFHEPTDEIILRSLVPHNVVWNRLSEDDKTQAEAELTYDERVSLGIDLKAREQDVTHEPTFGDFIGFDEEDL